MDDIKAIKLNYYQGKNDLDNLKLSIKKYISESFANKKFENI